MKSQTVRLLDVLVIGPAMIYMASRNDNVPQWGRDVMVLTGLATIAYNGFNYTTANKKSPD